MATEEAITRAAEAVRDRYGLAPDGSREGVIRAAVAGAEPVITRHAALAERRRLLVAVAEAGVSARLVGQALDLLDNVSPRDDRVGITIRLDRELYDWLARYWLTPTELIIGLLTDLRQQEQASRA